MQSPCEPASIMKSTAALLAVEIEPAVAVEHRRHGRERLPLRKAVERWKLAVTILRFRL